MTVTITEVPDEPGKLAVNGAFTIYSAPAAKATLMLALAKTHDLEIDLSGVDELDTAGVQLLILVKREAVKAGKQMRLAQHSSASIDVLDRYNLASYFGDPVVLFHPTQKETGST
jgi:anti-sigma B factor antagonist